MPAQIIFIHDDPKFVDDVTTSLRMAGHVVVHFADPMSALDALDTPRHFDVLLTRVQFPHGKPNGVALGLMASVKRPRIKVLFCAHPKFEFEADGVGDFMPAPISVPDVVDAVGRLLLE